MRRRAFPHARSETVLSKHSRWFGSQTHLLEIRALQMLELLHFLMIEGRVAGASASEQATGHLAISEGVEVENFLPELVDLPASA